MAPPNRITLPCGILLLCLASATAFAQGVGINATGAPADTSALLDLSSTAKGFLAPRMTSVQRAAIALPATGLVVYQTDGVAGLYWNAGTPGAPNWKQAADAAAGGPWTVSGPNIYYSAGNVGIGTSAPNAPLGFPPYLGKKITLYPGATGDVGIGVAGNRLQLYADNPNADVALGFDQAGVFNERFAVKPTGALAVNGNVGGAGQVLQSNGAAAAATWVSPTSVAYNNVYSVASTGMLEASGGVDLLVPGMSMGFATTGTARAIITLSLPLKAVTCPTCAPVTTYIRIHVDAFTTIMHAVTLRDGDRTTLTATEQVLIGAGNHNVWVGADTVTPGPSYTISYGSITPAHGELIVQVIPQ